MTDWANCAECGQAREKRVLDEHGVCPLCTMPVIQSGPNPYLPENTPYTLESVLTLRPGWWYAI